MIRARWFGLTTVLFAEKLLLLTAQRRAENGENLIFLFEHYPTFCFHYDKDLDAIRDLEMRRRTKEIPVLYPGAKIKKPRVEYSSGEIRGIPLVKTQLGRGGGMIYHGPGQIVMAPVWKLRPYFGIPQYIRALEETMIRILEQIFGIEAFRVRFDRDQNLWQSDRGHKIKLFNNQFRSGVQGVWTMDGDEARKIGFVGAKLLRQEVVVHGCALNISPGLEAFSLIDPCNLPGVEVTSVERLCGSAMPNIDLQDLAQEMAEIFSEIAGEDSVLFENDE